jgi:acetyltransferase-like isoleucine patch superfamily enzyme
MRDRTGKQLSSGEIMTKIARRLRTILAESEILVLHIVGWIPIHSIRRLFYKAAGMNIGNGSAIHTGARLYHPRGISIGNDTIIGELVVLDGRGKITIGNHVALATNVMMYTSEHDINDEHFKPIYEPITVNDYVFIGPGAIILPGVVIGKGAVVAAGAVVTKHVEDFSIVGGVPAKVIGKRALTNPSYKLGRASWFR